MSPIIHHIDLKFLMVAAWCLRCGSSDPRLGELTPVITKSRISFHLKTKRNEFYRYKFLPYLLSINNTTQANESLNRFNARLKCRGLIYSDPLLSMI